MNCIYCNSELIWQSDFDAEDYDYEFEGIVSVYDCPDCNTDFSVIDNFDDETITIIVEPNFDED